MNERIKELAERAEKLADKETKAFTDDTGHWRVIWNEVYDKKFAELIVKECAERLVQDDFGSVKGVMSIAGARLKEHFGFDK